MTYFYKYVTKDCDKREGANLYSFLQERPTEAFCLDEDAEKGV